MNEAMAAILTFASAYGLLVWLPLYALMKRVFNGALEFPWKDL